MKKPILDSDSLISDSAAKDLLEMASVLDCECPRHLVKILHSIREFKEYEKSCAIKSEKDREVHEWLADAAGNLDRMLSATISQLARMEGMIDENNCIVPLPRPRSDK